MIHFQKNIKIMGDDLNDIKKKCIDLGIGSIKEDIIYNIFQKTDSGEEIILVYLARPFVQLRKRNIDDIGIYLYFISATDNKSLRTSEIKNVTTKDGLLYIKTQNSTYIMKEG